MSTPPDDRKRICAGVASLSPEAMANAARKLVSRPGDELLYEVFVVAEEKQKTRNWLAEHCLARIAASVKDAQPLTWQTALTNLANQAGDEQEERAKYAKTMIERAAKLG